MASAFACFCLRVWSWWPSCYLSWGGQMLFCVSWRYCLSRLSLFKLYSVILFFRVRLEL